MRKLLTILFLLLPLLSQAQSPAKHLVRLGWGDMFYESLAFPSAGRDMGGHGYTGHIFAEYQYRITRVVSVGGQIDFEGIFTPEMDNYDLVLMPAVRFTYLNKPMVKLHSGVGIGLLVAFDNLGGCEPAPAVDLNFIGVELGEGPLTLGLDLGMMNALLAGSQVYLLGARLLSVSLNYRF